MTRTTTTSTSSETPQELHRVILVLMSDQNTERLRGGLIVDETVGRNREKCVYKMETHRGVLEGSPEWNRRMGLKESETPKYKIFEVCEVDYHDEEEAMRRNNRRKEGGGRQ